MTRTVRTVVPAEPGWWMLVADWSPPSSGYSRWRIVAWVVVNDEKEDDSDHVVEVLPVVVSSDANTTDYAAIEEPGGRVVDNCGGEWSTAAEWWSRSQNRSHPSDDPPQAL